MSNVYQQLLRQPETARYKSRWGETGLFSQLAAAVAGGGLVGRLLAAHQVTPLRSKTLQEKSSSFNFN